MKKFITSTFLILVTLLGFGQNTKSEYFKVICQKGENKLNTNTLITGTKLKSTDKITLTNDGFIGLLHSSGKTLELKKEGTYLVSTLIQKFNETKKNTSEKYAEFIINELNKEVNNDLNLEYKKNMKISAAVERGNKNSCHFILPKSTLEKPFVYTSNNSLTIYWNSTLNSTSYLFKILDEEEAIQKTIEIVDTTFTLDFSTLKLGPKNELLIQVSKKGEAAENKIDKRIIVVIKEDTLNQKVKAIENSLKDNNAINNYLKAEFYAQNNLIAKAIEHYKKAIKAEPQINEFKIALNNLLLTNGLEDFIVE